jgi:hypothetical protein
MWQEAVVAHAKAPPRHFPRGTEENHEKPQNNQSPDQNLKPGPPELVSYVRLDAHDRTTYVIRNFTCSKMI